MRSIKKVTMLTLAGLMAFSTVACGGGGESSGGKTVVRLDAFESGYGVQWIRDSEVEFEKRFAEHSFEEGKKGVDLKLNITKSMDIDGMSSSGTDIYMMGTNNYPYSLARKRFIADLSDVVNEKYDDRNGTQVSIADKIKDEFLPALKGTDDHIYGLPLNEGIAGGLSYDKELFDKNNFYIADPVSNGTNTADDLEPYSDFGLSTNFIAHKNAKKSCGADGKYGTYDDGLPTALTELLLLCSKIKDTNSAWSPLTIGGTVNGYSKNLINALAMSMGGYEEARALYDFEGDVTYVTGYSNDNIFETIDWLKKPTVDTVTIDGKNAYLATQTEARYYANAFVDIAVNKGWFSADANSNTTTHTDTQGNFICGGLTNNLPVSAMIIEGSYWWTEATEANKFEYYKTLSGGKDREDRDIRWMALPVTIDEPIFTKEDKKVATLISTSTTEYVVVNRKTENKPGTFAAVKEYLKMIYSDEGMDKYTASTGCRRLGMEYEITQATKDNMPNFNKSLFDLQSSDMVKTVYATSNKTTVLSNFIYLTGYYARPAISVGTNVIQYANALNALREGRTAKEIFESTLIDAEEWDALYLE